MPSESAGFVVNSFTLDGYPGLELAYLLGIVSALTNNFPELFLFCGYILSLVKVYEDL